MRLAIDTEQRKKNDSGLISFPAPVAVCVFGQGNCFFNLQMRIGRKQIQNHLVSWKDGFV